VLLNDPTDCIQRKINSFILKLRKLNLIEEKLKDELTSYNSVAPRFYGLPKVHKKDRPLRPVVSCIKAPTYNLSKLLARILAFSTNEEINVGNSFELMTRLQDLQLDNDEIFLSIDAIAMFSCIPVQLVLRIVIEKCLDYQPFTSIPSKIPNSNNSSSMTFEFLLKIK